MDVALKGGKDVDAGSLLRRFNPCFGGCRSESGMSKLEVINPNSFNPCFGGCRSESRRLILLRCSGSRVSILVLVDVALKVILTKV